MVISEEHRYLFVEVPETASWAIREELCAHYGGQSILHKHATFPEFARVARRDHAGYFVFASVRNPLDGLVSRYLKYRLPLESASGESQAGGAPVFDYADMRRWSDVRANRLSFGEYFAKYHRWPIGSLIDRSRRRLDYVIRYEDLQSGFAEVLRRLHLPQVRELPVVNPTAGKYRSFLEYYDADSAKRAIHVCGPFMRRWGYQLPDEWAASGPGLIDRLQYHGLDLPRQIYMTHFRYSSSRTSDVVRRVRARLFR